MRQRHTKAGFSLVELAIVLVIIGLISGGILYGTDLIRSGEIRRFTNEMNRFNAAAFAFRTKYTSLPGDLSGSRATSYGLVARTGAAAHGDGDGQIESCTVGGQRLGCETSLFWRDLADSKMITARITTAADGYVDGTAGGFAVQNHMPQTKLRADSYYFVYPFQGNNTYYVGGVAAVSNVGVITTSKGLSVREARDIDAKLDDGNPTSGTVRAMSDLSTIDAGAAAAAGVCVLNTTTPASYNATEQYLDEINCNITLSNYL